MTIIDDLIAEAEAVDVLVADLDDAQWELPTPAKGWAVKHQIGHLAFVFRIAGMSAADPDAFRAMTASLQGFGKFDAAVNAALDEYVNDPPEALLTRWRAERDAGIKALAAVPADELVPWFVNPLPPGVLATAGMMELFGHGQDIADALGVRRQHTDRVAHLVGFIAHTRDFGYQARELPSPEQPFRFEVTLPSGSPMAIGPEHGAERVVGDAVDLCLLATRRRHRDDLNLFAVGDEADHWLDIAQAYRGPSGEGRQPGQFD